MHIALNVKNGFTLRCTELKREECDGVSEETNTMWFCDGCHNKVAAALKNGKGKLELEEGKEASACSRKLEAKDR